MFNAVKYWVDIKEFDCGTAVNVGGILIQK